MAIRVWFSPFYDKLLVVILDIMCYNHYLGGVLMKRFRPHSIYSKIFRVVLILFLIVLLLAAAVFWFVWSKLGLISYDDSVADTHESSSSPTEPNFDPIEATNVVPVEDLLSVTEPDSVISDPADDISANDSVLNILLIGTDERTTDYITNARSDCMIVVSINKELKTVRLVSLERGIGVPILEGDLKGQYDLLTHVFRWGGADLLLKTVRHCFELDIEHYVRLNFAAVEKIIDAVGGIDMHLKAREVPEVYGWPEDTDKVAYDGMYHLDGRRALNFARLRSIDSDWQRVQRQRKVILSVVDELKDSSLMELNDLADVALPLIQTNLTQLEVAELLLYAPNFLKSEFDQMTIPKQGTYGATGIPNGKGFAVDFEINNDLLYRFLYEGVSSEELLAE